MSWWALTVNEVYGAFGLVSWIFWIVLSICLHELGHGYAAIRQGDDTPVRMNRMTLDPLVHMGGMSLLLLALIGFAWGQMPVNPVNFKNYSRGITLVALAGPAVNLFLAFICATAWCVWAVYVGDFTTASENVLIFFYIGAYLNILLLVFNLLPVPPLDGASALGGISIRAREFFRQPEIAQFAFFGLLALVWFGGGRVLHGICSKVLSVYGNFVVGLLA